MQNLPIYNYYFSGNWNLKFRSYRAVEDYLRTLTSEQVHNMHHPYYAWCIVRESQRTGRKVYFEINPLNYCLTTKN